MLPLYQSSENRGRWEMNGASVLCWFVHSLVTFLVLIKEISATSMTYALVDKQRKSVLLTVLKDLTRGDTMMQKNYFMMFPRFPLVSEN